MVVILCVLNWLRHALYKYHQTQRVLQKLLWATTTSCETWDTCLLIGPFDWRWQRDWQKLASIFMKLYQNDDRTAKIFISETKQVFWDMRTWNMIVIQPWQSAMERNNPRDKKRKSRIFCLSCQYFWSRLIAKFPENIWLVTRWLTNENIINRFCSELMGKKLSIIWN